MGLALSTHRPQGAGTAATENYTQKSCNAGIPGQTKTVWFSYGKDCHDDPHIGLPGIPNLWLSSGWAAKDTIKLGPDVVVPLDSVGGGIWETVPPWRGILLYLPINDYGSLPLDVLASHVGIICRFLKEEKTVYVFCVGGHGRTGYIASAVVGKMLPDVDDPVQYVRDCYCYNAVESQTQLDSLAEFLGKPELKNKHTKQWHALGAYSSGHKYKTAERDTCWYCDHFKTSMPTRCGLRGEGRKGNDKICDQFVHFAYKETHGKKPSTNAGCVFLDNTQLCCDLGITPCCPTNCAAFEESIVTKHSCGECISFWPASQNPHSSINMCSLKHRAAASSDPACDQFDPAELVGGNFAEKGLV